LVVEGEISAYIIVDGNGTASQILDLVFGRAASPIGGQTFACVSTKIIACTLEVEAVETLLIVRHC
jgi:hypothetical protein